MIDIHSHIIPFIDDGAKDEKMAIDMIKKAAESGTSKIVATPHYIYGRYDVDFKDLEDKLMSISKKVDGIEIYLGQEVYYSSKILEYYKEEKIGTINKSNYMLIELPMKDFDIKEVKNNIYELQIRGIKPIIAHPERYEKLIKKPELINEFIEEDYLFQLNSGSLTGQFGKQAKKLSKILLDKNIYNFIGSDGHRDKGRDTDMRRGIEEINIEYLKFINESSTNMLENKDVLLEGEKISKKSIFSIFGR